MSFPEIRLRRLRRTKAIRRLFDQPFPAASKFVWPLFVVEGQKRHEAISSMPGQYRMSPDELLRAVEPVAKQGIGGVPVMVGGQAFVQQPELHRRLGVHFMGVDAQVAVNLANQILQ